MTTKQEIFLCEYLRTNDKIKAYQIAYPKAKESSLKTLANRLLQTNPAIKAATAGKRAEMYVEAEAEARTGIEDEIMDLLELKRMLTLTARGQRMIPKEWRTRDGFVSHPVHPSHAQALGAMRQFALLEGWYAQAGAAAKKQEQEKKNEPVRFKFTVAGLPLEEYTALRAGANDAYFDPEEGNSKWWPVDAREERFVERNQRRQARKDAEREQRMTPALKLEEEQAMYAFERRETDEAGYEQHDKVIDRLIDEYIDSKEEAKLKEVKTVQKMCGLRFLHHRHRYEAEREAGWEFHPLNNSLIRRRFQAKTLETAVSELVQASSLEPNKGRHVESNEASPELMQENQSFNQRNRSNQRFRQEEHQNRQQPTEGSSLSPLERHQHRQHLTTFDDSSRHSERREESPEPMQAAKPEPPPKPTTLDILKQGYKPLNELLQDEYDYYLKNQGSTTWQQLNELRKFYSHRKSPPEVRKQIEQETGWLYHPDEPNYAKRQPGKPLFRTKFPGPPGWPV